MVEFSLFSFFRKLGNTGFCNLQIYISKVPWTLISVNFGSFQVPTLVQLEKTVHYKYRLYKTKRYATSMNHSFLVKCICGHNCQLQKKEKTTLIPQFLGSSVAEFKEFERRFKFKPRFKYDWFHWKLYQMFQDLSRRLI